MSKKQALARLMKLESWMDTDEEVLEGLPEHIRSDHEFIIKQIRLAIEELNDG